MSLVAQQDAFAQDLSKLILHIKSQNYSCTFGETYRTQQQSEWYAARGMGIKDSLHCQRLAVDLNIFKPDGSLITTVADYKPFGEYWQSLNKLNRWGGIFSRPDANHFERRRV